MFVDCGVSLFICEDVFHGCVSVSVRKLTFTSKFVFVEDVNLWGRASHEYHENWATTNSNDSTV